MNEETTDDDAWDGQAPRILSDEEAHCLVDGVMNIAKAHGWLDHDLNIFEWLEQKLSSRDMPQTTIPDFGLIQSDVQGIPMTCRAIAPGLSIHDLVMIFDEAHNAAQPGDEMAGNPSRWPVTRGIKAVADAVLIAVYGWPNVR